MMKEGNCWEMFAEAQRPIWTHKLNIINLYPLCAYQDTVKRGTVTVTIELHLCVFNVCHKVMSVYDSMSLTAQGAW